MSARSSFLVCLAASIVHGSDVISADQAGGSPAAAGSQMQYAAPHSSYGRPMSEAEYHQAVLRSSGSSDSTAWIMMGTVALGYLCIFIVMSTAW